MSERTPIRVPAAPKDWRMSPDQMVRVAQDPRLHRLSNDELYLYFNQPKPKPSTYQNILRFLHIPEDWQAQAFSWHPANTLNRASAALREANDRGQ